MSDNAALPNRLSSRSSARGFLAPSTGFNLEAASPATFDSSLLPVFARAGTPAYNAGLGGAGMTKGAFGLSLGSSNTTWTSFGDTLSDTTTAANPSSGTFGASTPKTGSAKPVSSYKTSDFGGSNTFGAPARAGSGTLFGAPTRPETDTLFGAPTRPETGSSFAAPASTANSSGGLTGTAAFLGSSFPNHDVPKQRTPIAPTGTNTVGKIPACADGQSTRSQGTARTAPLPCSPPSNPAIGQAAGVKESVVGKVSSSSGISSASAGASQTTAAPAATTPSVPAASTAPVAATPHRLAGSNSQPLPPRESATAEGEDEPEPTVSDDQSGHLAEEDDYEEEEQNSVVSLREVADDVPLSLPEGSCSLPILTESNYRAWFGRLRIITAASKLDRFIDWNNPDDPAPRPSDRALSHLRLVISVGLSDADLARTDYVGDPEWTCQFLWKHYLQLDQSRADRLRKSLQTVEIVDNCPFKTWARLQRYMHELEQVEPFYARFLPRQAVLRNFLNALPAPYNVAARAIVVFSGSGPIDETSVIECLKEAERVMAANEVKCGFCLSSGHDMDACVHFKTAQRDMGFVGPADGQSEPTAGLALQQDDVASSVVDLDGPDRLGVVSLPSTPAESV